MSTKSVMKTDRDKIKSGSASGATEKNDDARILLAAKQIKYIATNQENLELTVF